MCLLTFVPPGVQPDTDALRNGTIVNDDGHGFAIVTGAELLVRRGLDGEQIIDEFAAQRSRHPGGPALFHSRLGTHGTVGEANCHPFAVGGDARTVLAHNGILPSVVQPAPTDPRSDTRIAAEDFVPLLGPLRHRRTRLRLQRWMGAHNKIVVLSADRRFRRPAYILNERAGAWDGGIWYSNDGYLPRLSDSWLTRAWASADAWAAQPAGVPLGRCEGCAGWLDWLEGDCPLCGWCLDCASAPQDCQCFLPAPTRRLLR